MDMTPEQRAEFAKIVDDWQRGYDLSWLDMRRRLGGAEGEVEIFTEFVRMLLADLPPPCKDPECVKPRCVAKRVLADLVGVSPSEEDPE